MTPVAKPGRKAARKGAKGRPFRKGADPRRNVTKPGTGRPPDEFKAMLAQLASRDETIAAIRQILDNPAHPQFLRALEFAAERGYGKAAQPVEVTGANGGAIEVTVTRRIIPASAPH